MNRFAVVAVGYNRIAGLSRLLDSLSAACYDEDVDLIISLDKSTIQDELIKIANDFLWKHGKKIIRHFPIRQGLRNHILSCGDLTEQYYGVVVLEDDLIVSPFFFNYVKTMLDVYGDDENIAGISLYKHCLQVDCNRPFVPDEDGNSIYLMQFAQSWGECWNQRMWNGFKEWYSRNSNKPVVGNHLPNCVCRWNEKSWMKYFMKFIVENNKYFVYPRISLTTCCADAGEHGNNGTNDYQVPLLNGHINYKTAPFNALIKYDVFFERQYIKTKYNNLCVDLYGTKKTFDGFEYLASTKRYQFKIIDTYALKFRPHEINLINCVKGDEIYIYKLGEISKTKFKKNENALTRYDVKTLSWKRLLRYGFLGLIVAVKRRLFRK